VTTVNSIGGVFVALVALTATAPCTAAQRAVSVHVSLTNQSSVALAWVVTSVIPPPGRPVFATFHVERSTDLTQWQKISDPLSATNGTLQFVDPSGTLDRAFYRVGSEVDLSFANLIGARLDNGELGAANLFGAELFGASLLSADLSHSMLSGADLGSADLTESDLTGADLFGANLLGAKLESVSLENADLRFSQLGNADLFAADLTGADLRSAVFDGADLRGVAFRDTKLDENAALDDKSRLIWHIVNEGPAGLKLRNSDLSFAELAGVDLHGLDLSQTIFTAADLSNTDLRGANLGTADLRVADLSGALLDTNTVVATKWRVVRDLATNGGAGRDLHGIDLSFSFLLDVSMTNVNLVGANLSSSAWFRVDLSHGRLSQANLRDADLNGSDLSFANLRGAITNGAIFDQVIFNQTIMPDGSIRPR